MNSLQTYQCPLNKCTGNKTLQFSIDSFFEQVVSAHLDLRFVKIRW